MVFIPLKDNQIMFVVVVVFFLNETKPVEFGDIVTQAQKIQSIFVLNTLAV